MANNVKKSTWKKTNDPTKIQLGPQVKTTWPDARHLSRLLKKIVVKMTTYSAKYVLLQQY